MSEKVGPIAYGSDKEIFIGRDMASHVTYSEKTASVIDQEIKDIVHNALAKARELLKENKVLLDTMARVLVERETIFTEEVDMIMDGKSADEIIAFMDENERTLSENPFARKGNSAIIKDQETDTNQENASVQQPDNASEGDSKEE